MGKDYYTMLGLSENASEDEVRKALKRFSDEKNKEVAEAYEALRNLKRRDTSGRTDKEGLKDNARARGPKVPDNKGNANTSKGSSEAADEELHDPCGGFFGHGGPFGSNFFNESSPREGRRDDRDNVERYSIFGDLLGQVLVNETSELELHVTLEEVYNGCTKKVKVTRSVIAPGGRVPTVDEKVFTVEVKPGWKAGTRITFHCEGNQLRCGSVPGDLVFVIRDKPHPHFRRDGVDVRYSAKITFKEAMRGGTVEVPTLTHGKITVPLTNIVTATTVKRIPGQGLPHPKDPTARGDLLLSFDIECPRHTTEAERQRLWDALCPFI